MSLCVPEWDGSGGMLGSVVTSNGFHGSVNGRVEFVSSRKSHYSEVPDQDTLEAGWNDNEHIDMQGQSSKCSKSQWQYASAWSGGHGIEDGVTPPKPIIPKSDASLEAVVNETATEAHLAHSIDDEMVSWLQYPLDATLERNYCSEFFGKLPASNTQLLKESFGHGATRAVRSSYPVAPGNDNVSNRAAIADAAMMMGAGRAAGLLPQTGVEAFSKVRTLQSQQPSTHTRWPQPHTSQSNGSNMCATSNLAPKAPTSAPLSNPMLPPKIQPIAPLLNSQSPPGNRPGSMNFSHFSRPAAMIKANLHSLAAGSLQVNHSSSPNAARPKQQPNRIGRPIAEASTSTSSCIAESTTGCHQEVNVQLEVIEREQSNGIDNSRWHAAPSVSPTKDGDRVASGDEFKSTPADQETCRQSGVTSDAVLASSEKGVSHVTQQPDVQEPTITSSSGGYGTSAERPKEAATSTKRKSSEREDAECQSEDGEGESVDTKKPVTGRGSTTKRSRAAEVHNQSERRRRDRINEKMRALQELIPNSNKTDKASMLDEAIEYLKMLQLQLQMMSIRTGMTLPPMVVPSGLQQHMQMPQMAGMPSMGMGMGMLPMGLGMGMMDMGVSGPGRPVMPMPSHAGPSLNGNMASSSTVLDMHDLRYQTSNGVPMDSYNAYLGRQHQPMQMNQPLNMDKYNAYMLQHHQLQQHQQHQQQQLSQHQQHQQHQIHQQAPNMNGDPPH
ncbi:hypothetical protein M758_2G001600 [Ceratodon purpureus]|uniref:BHLH domain-containing protein n=1 Tax=Ceratodon purpureus TaxID=3225 RepID=A0A8T0IR65_CERPU|nr:hypothetical protein KC19_2G001500 [Ceratodon purpureus]KAG0624758.1 hypothetical protein M758_2G001600 [Ceratodon purpureus]